MLIVIPKEIADGENRVAVIPQTLAALKKAKLDIVVQSGAGAGAFISDEAYANAGAVIETDVRAMFAKADVVLKIQPPMQNNDVNCHEVDMLKEGSILISLLDAYSQLDVLKKMAERNITTFGLEFVPRTTRAQSMDVLSSMAAIAGYSAVLESAALLPKYFPMLMTAAGTITPAKVFVIGAGVAGLMAISTAKRLGAVVEAYDTRPVVKEQVESLGAKFVEFDLGTQDAQDKGGYAKAQSEDFYRKQQEQMAAKVATVDVVITTAAIPGKPSPRLITDAMIQQMHTGSVIVDLAAERGGNAEGTVCGQIVEKHGVKLVGYIDYPSRKSVHASQLFSKNISTFLLNMVKDGALNLNMEDEIIKGALVVHEKQIVHPALKPLLEQPQ
ncbi:MAG: Re/Si-specific NAD(P)(+) transhydrogenase subunit alpha [SAR324 cluster bacterium]|nr:Re/Si-specific NAD(P)(+) transhydrogenase subunit alpha [SAR324 cluster bacterium]